MGCKMFDALNIEKENNLEQKFGIPLPLPIPFEPKLPEAVF